MIFLFTETENDSVPVQEFIESLPAKHGAKEAWRSFYSKRRCP